MSDEEESDVVRRNRLEGMVKYLEPVRPMQTLRDIRWLLDRDQDYAFKVERLEAQLLQYDQRLTVMRVELENRDADNFEAGVVQMSAVRDTLGLLEQALRKIAAGVSAEEAQAIAQDAMKNAPLPPPGVMELTPMVRK